MDRLSDFIIIDLIIIFCLNAHTHTHACRRTKKLFMSFQRDLTAIYEVINVRIKQSDSFTFMDSFCVIFTDFLNCTQSKMTPKIFPIVCRPGISNEITGFSFRQQPIHLIYHRLKNQRNTNTIRYSYLCMSPFTLFLFALNLEQSVKEKK